MKQLLFIGGFPSGGTDLTKTVLNAHPDVDICGEMPFLISLEKEGYNQSSRFSNKEQCEEFTSKLSDLDIYNRINNLDFDTGPGLSQGHEFTVDELLWSVLTPEKSSIRGFKTPQYTEHLPRLYPLFPSAKFLIVVRDVRDVCLSWDKKWGKNMVLCADKWAKRLSLAYQFTDQGQDGRTLFIKYEDLLDAPEKTARSICEFLNIPFSESMLEHEKHTKEIIDGKLNYGQGIIAGNKNKWRNKLSPEKVLRLEQIAFNAMQMFDYEVDSAKAYKKLGLFELLYGRLRDVHALLFIGNRSLSKENKNKIRIKSLFIEIKKLLGL